MQKSNRYTLEGRIRFSEVDHTRRITLPGIINYFQDCSTFHSESLGVGLSYCAKRRKVWILSAWQVEVERYPVMGEPVKISTWATKFDGLLGLRNFCMEDEDGRAAVYANSLWMYMDMKKGRPVKPDIKEIEAYGIGQALEMEYASRKITLPESMKEFPVIPVKKYQIDTNEHVNNCQYVQMALELFTKDREARQIRTEYRKSAVYGDVILPKAAEEEERAVAELCDTEGKPYAVVEIQWA